MVIFINTVFINAVFTNATFASATKLTVVSDKGAGLLSVAIFIALAIRKARVQRGFYDDVATRFDINTGWAIFKSFMNAIRSLVAR